jgi:hemoglobin/transferrin/lactoferrin receptor protein
MSPKSNNTTKTQHVAAREPLVAALAAINAPLPRIGENILASRSTIALARNFSPMINMRKHNIHQLLLCAATLTLSLAATTSFTVANAQENAPTTATPATAPTAKPTPPKPATVAKTATPAASDVEKKADMTVVVIATRIAESPYQVAGSTDVITPDEIGSSGTTSLGDTFKYVPGVVVPFSAGVASGASSYTTGGDKGINIRGLEGDRVAIIADGIVQPDDFNAGGGAASPGRIYIDPAVYGQVEVFKTAASSLYGSGALGGAVATNSVGPEQLLGKTLSGYTFVNTATYATVNSSINNLVQGAVGDGKWAASAVYSARKGQENESKGISDLNPQHFRSQAVIAKLNRKLDGMKLEGVIDYYYLGQDIIGTNAEGVMNMGPTMRYEYLTPTQDIARERLRFSLGAEISRSTVLYDSASITGYWQNTTSRVQSHDVTNTVRGTVATRRERINTIDNGAEITGINSVARKTLASASVTQTIQYGFEGSIGNNSLNFTRIENGNPAADAFVMTPADVYRAGVFASDKVELGNEKKYVLTPSLRVDYYNVNPENTAEYFVLTNAKAGSFVNLSVSPGLSALYKITPDINVYGLYAMGTRNPTSGELNGVFSHSGGGAAGGQLRIVPNPDLKEEVANNFELGVQGNTERHAFRLAGFYNIYDNFIETEFDTGTVDDEGYAIYTSRNLDKVNIYGIEASWHWNIDKKLFGGVDGFQIGASAAWTKGRQDTDYGTQPLDSIDPFRFVAYVGYIEPANAWGVRLSATFVAKKSSSEISYTISANGAKSYSYAPVDSAFVVDLAGFYRFNDNWTINVGINNLTDKEYVSWSSARVSGGGMSSKRYAQPGLNGFVALTAKF